MSALESVIPAPPSVIPAKAGIQRLNDPRIWSGRELAPAPAMPTGHAPLDALLPGGGWPLGALTELIFDRPGIGELSLLAPALARVSRSQGVALVGAPHRACGPGWAQRQISLEQLLLVQAAAATDRLWAAGQSLRSGAFGAVLLWLGGAVAEKELRRLQLAAEEGGGLAFLFRDLAAERHSSPAALRLRLRPGLHISILKSRGGAPRSLELALPGRRRAPRQSHVVAMPVPAAPAARCPR